MEICDKNYRLISIERLRCISASFYTIRSSSEERDVYKFLVQKVLTQIPRDYKKRNKTK